MYRVLMIAGIAAAMLNGCSQKSEPETQASTAWMLTAEPEGALSVVDAKSSAKENDRIAVRGRIGGRTEVLTAGSTVFTLVDLGLAHCAENPADACPTPWDYCCATPEVITANAATVQIVDEAGESVSGDLRKAGLSELDEVIIVGTVGARPNDSVLTIRATGVYIVESEG